MNLQQLATDIAPPLSFKTFLHARRGRGQPTKCTDELIADLEDEYDRCPIGQDAVCDKLGISPQTRRNWFKLGEPDYDAGVDSPHAQFFGVFKKARGFWQGKLLEKALEGSQQWAAYVTLLERIWPMEFGRRNEETNVARVQVFFGGRPDDIRINGQVIDARKAIDVGTAVDVGST